MVLVELVCPSLTHRLSHILVYVYSLFFFWHANQRHSFYQKLGGKISVLYLLILQFFVYKILALSFYVNNVAPMKSLSLFTDKNVLYVQEVVAHFI